MRCDVSFESKSESVATELISIPFDQQKWNQQKALGLFYFVAQPARWAKWALYDRVALRAGVLLSLNVDPHPYGLIPTGDLFEMVCSALDDVAAPNSYRIHQRLSLAESHLGERLARAGEVDGEAAVRLRDLASWALAVPKWELPAEFMRCATSADAAIEGETRLERAVRIAKAKFRADLAKGEPWPTNVDGAQWLMREQLVSSDKDAQAVLKVIRPDLRPGPRVRSGDEDEE